ncbi:MAG: prohibitin family protein [Anaerolineales bacterium]|jgi:regulator of protease activity HflC (stomatin/prohibitin superfamily)
MNFANAFQGVVALLWLVVIGLIVLSVVRASRGQAIRATTTSIVVLAVVALILTSVSAGLVFIEPEERGVVVSAVSPTGFRENALQPGLRWVIPFLERVEVYSVDRQTYTMSIAPAEGQIEGDDSITARTADGQEIFMDASVIYQIDPSKVVRLHIDWQKRYVDEMVRPLARGVIRDAVSQYGVEQVYSSRRADLQQDIQNNLDAKYEENGLNLVEFVLRNITFSPEYAASVEQKQIAEQQAQQARFVVEQRKQEAEQARQVAQGKADAAVIEAEGAAQARVIEAQAEQQALDLIAQALQDNSDLLTYQYITKLAPGVQVMLVPNNAPYLLPLPTIEPAVSGSSTSESSAVPTPPPTAVPSPSPTPTATP